MFKKIKIALKIMQVPFINFEYEYEQFENEYNILLKIIFFKVNLLVEIRHFENNLKIIWVQNM